MNGHISAEKCLSSNFEFKVELHLPNSPLGQVRMVGRLFARFRVPNISTLPVMYNENTREIVQWKSRDGGHVHCLFVLREIEYLEPKSIVYLGMAGFVTWLYISGLLNSGQVKFDLSNTFYKHCSYQKQVLQALQLLK